MSNLSVLRNHLKLNADVITMLQCAMLEARMEAAAWKAQGETAYFIAACDDARKFKRKLERAVEMQRRTKVEIQAIFRKEHIRQMYLFVFGKLPEQQINTSHEQHAMLSALAAERRAALKEEKEAREAVA